MRSFYLRLRQEYGDQNMTEIEQIFREYEGYNPLAYEGELELTELRIIGSDGRVILQEEREVRVTELKFNDKGVVEEAFIDGKLQKASEGLVIELDNCGNVRAVTFEFLGSGDEAKQSFKREQIFQEHRNRFMGMSDMEYENHPRIYASMAYARNWDYKNNIKKGD